MTRFGCGGQVVRHEDKEDESSQDVTLVQVVNGVTRVRQSQLSCTSLQPKCGARHSRQSMPSFCLHSHCHLGNHQFASVDMSVCKCQRIFPHSTRPSARHQLLLPLTSKCELHSCDQHRCHGAATTCSCLQATRSGRIAVKPSLNALSPRPLPRARQSVSSPPPSASSTSTFALFLLLCTTFSLLSGKWSNRNGSNGLVAHYLASTLFFSDTISLANRLNPQLCAQFPPAYCPVGMACL